MLLRFEATAPQRQLGEWVVENLYQISHFFTSCKN